MNFYLLVEGEQTELQLYPKWLSYIIPELTRVDSFTKITKNSYYIFSGGGIPSTYNHAVNAIKDINVVGKYDYLIIVLDAEEISPERRKEKLLEHIKDANVQLQEGCQLEVIVHNRCVETWFLGNRKIYKRNPQGERFQQYSRHYNVEIDDPELMPKLPNFKLTAHFHIAYLKEMLAEQNVRYRKSRPKEVLERYYFDELVKRVEDLPSHLQSFSNCLQILQTIKSKLVS